jgi:hypothetical protein
MWNYLVCREGTTSTTREDDLQAKRQNITTTTGLCIDNNMPLQYEHPRKGSKYMFG